MVTVFNFIIFAKFLDNDLYRQQEVKDFYLNWDHMINERGLNSASIAQKEAEFVTFDSMPQMC